MLAGGQGYGLGGIGTWTMYPVITSVSDLLNFPRWYKKVFFPL
jgi:hypothetical protein